MAGSGSRGAGGTTSRRRARRAVLAVTAVLATLPFVGPAQAAPGPSARLEQCENGKAATPKACDWVTGNLGPHNSHWAEGESVPYRLKLDNLSTSGTHTVTVEWDPTKGGKHAFDYLTTYDRSATTAATPADPCVGVTGCAVGTFSTASIPADPEVTTRGKTPIAGNFTIWNGAFTAVSAYTTSGSYSGDSSTRITLTFTASAANPVIAWSAHVAADAQWGTGTAASTISGSPYHMRLIEIDGLGGNQDRSMKVAPGPVPGSITIVKQASVEGSRAFSFTASDGLGNFSLVDDGDDTTAPFNSMTFDGLTDFHGVSGNTYDFTETVPTGWQVPSIGCSTGANVTNAGSTLTVRLAEDTHVTCTYTNTNVAPTVSITKTPSTPTVPEPGATVTYQLRITNTAAEDVTLYEVDDNRFGSQNTACGVPRTLTAGQTFTCSFDGPVTGDAGDLHTNTATARVRDADGSTAFATAQATVAVTDVLPTITVSKTATPVTLTEPGGRVTFVVVVDNTSVEPVTVDSVTDSVYNDVTSGTNPRIVASTCATGAVVPAGDQSTCSFTVDIAGNAGFTETNRIEVAVHDDDGNSTTATDTATVTVADAKPVVAVDKTASKGAVRNGETVTYTYVVTTAGAESLLDVKVTDDRCSPVTFATGDADGDGKLDPGESWTYTCATKLTSTTTNTVAVEAEDDEGNAATASDSATVRVVDPRIAVDKSAEPRSATPGDRVLYTYLVTNPGDAELTQVVVSDDKCSPVTFATGDADSDGALDPGETWRYTCTVTVGSDIGSLTNLGTVTARDPTGGTVSADDRETISIVLGAVIERPRAGAQAALPRTGQDVRALSLAGAALVALGGVLLACAPRRRPAA